LVLVSGKGECEQVANSYGFTKVVTIEQYAAHRSQMTPNLEELPFKKKLKVNLEEPISAIFCMHDPTLWGVSLQICLDILMSDGRPENRVKSQQIPIYFSNPDIVYSDEFKYPRLAHGSFRKCLEFLYKEHTGKKLKYTQFGKPSPATYDFCESLLREQAEHAGLELGKVYGNYYLLFFFSAKILN